MYALTNLNQRNRLKNWKVKKKETKYKKTNELKKRDTTEIYLFL